MAATTCLNNISNKFDFVAKKVVYVSNVVTCKIIRTFAGVQRSHAAVFMAALHALRIYGPWLNVQKARATFIELFV